jgi:hypothetical protein
MKSRDWKDIAELIGITAIVASLIFVGLQMRQAQSIANAERRQVRVANMIELNNAINEHAEIWARGKSGEELDEVETVIFANLMLDMEEFVYFSMRAARDLGEERGADATLTEFTSFLYENPGARQVFEARQNHRIRYQNVLMPSVDVAPGGWFDAIRTNLVRLDQMIE